MLDIFLISNTSVDWQSYLRTCKTILDRNPTKELDINGKQIGDLGSYLLTLSELKYPGISIADALSFNNSIFDHGFVTIGLISSKTFLFELIQEVRLTITLIETIRLDYYLAIISGTVREWKETIIKTGTHILSVDFRIFSNKALLIFEKIGLGLLFNKYDKVLLNDSTYELAERR